jgi:proteic killer suppression protein
MIISFGSKETEKVWRGIRIRKPSIELQEIARRKFRMLNNSVDLNDLKTPPSNRLEKLTGKLSEYYSIRVNNQWRIIFKLNKGNASDVKLIDYH